MTTKIAITGLIGSGKSTAIEYLKKLDIPCIKLDDLSRAALAKNTEAYNAVVAKLGTDILLATGEIDRKKLREQAFQDNLIKWLEDLIHPIVLKNLDTWVKGLNSDICVIEVPAIETIDFFAIADKIIVLTCKQDKIYERVKTRDNVQADSVANILSNQILETKLCELADVTIANNGSVDELYQELDSVFKRKKPT